MSTTSSEPPPATGAPWEQRFRAPAIAFSSIAIDAPEVGLVSSNRSGIPQLYRWDTATGTLTQLTFDPDGRHRGPALAGRAMGDLAARHQGQRDRPLGR